MVKCFFLLIHFLVLEDYESPKSTSHVLSVSLNLESWSISFCFYFNCFPDDILCKIANWADDNLKPSDLSQKDEILFSTRFSTIFSTKFSTIFENIHISHTYIHTYTYTANSILVPFWATIDHKNIFTQKTLHTSFILKNVCALHRRCFYKHPLFTKFLLVLTLNEVF